MPRLMWALLCQRVITDREANSVSYIEAAEALLAASLPSPLPQIFLGTVWLRKKSGDVLRMRLKVLAPDGGEVVTRELPEVPFDEKKRHRLNVNLAGMPVEKTGEYEFVVEQKVGRAWREEARVPLEILLNAGATEFDASDELGDGEAEIRKPVSQGA